MAFVLGLRAARAAQTQKKTVRLFGTKYVGNDGMTNYSLVDVPKEGTPSVTDSDRPFLGSNLIIQWMEGVKRYGFQRTMNQAYTMGQIKFGECVGEDVNGNRYYENPDYQHGQHRWIEYKDIHNPDASSIPPEWRGWMCHMQDAPGASTAKFLEEKLGKSHQVEGHPDDSGIDTHLGHTEYKMEEIMNWTSFRQRGYKIGGIKQLPGDADKYHVHAGHLMNKESKGRFEKGKGMHLWDPDSDAPPPELTRSLDEN